jgi:hypothetical protein
MVESHAYDRSSKWLIQHHGDSILRLANVSHIMRWRPAQAEVVQPRQTPDGLLEVQLEGADDDAAFLIEVATYPQRRINQQLTRDTMLVYLDRDELPEVITLVLRPKGQYRVPGQIRLRSRHGLTACTLTRRVVELWKVSAEDLLAAGDVGLVPWAILADSPDPPEKLARRCRESIETNSPAGEKENLIAVVQVLARLRYNEDSVFAALGGKKLMIESPLIQEIVAEAVAEAMHKSILGLLQRRFGATPSDIEVALRAVLDEDRLAELNATAGTCLDLDAFRKALA